MSNILPVRRKLLKAVEQIIPCVRQDNFQRMVLAQPPMTLPSDVQIKSHCGKPLTENNQGHLHLFLNQWPKQKLHAVRFPYLGYVLEGEVDWRIGITQSVAKKLPESFAQCDYQILTLPQDTFFLMPPGAPYSEGGVHWERPEPKRATSRIFWLQVLPSGAFCHICHTSGGVHTSDFSWFVRDAHLASLVELLTLELQTRAPHFESVARAQLLSLFLRVGRALVERKAFESDAELADQTFQQNARQFVAPLNEQTVKRACSFIEAHLHEALTPAIVASHAFVSPSHLNRLFHHELGLPIMKYVLKRRLETAKSLLVDSDLPIQEVGTMVGYLHPSHFTQVFSRELHISPLEYRKRQRAKVLL